ncbi:hypothetical protein L3Q82_016997, partial [Scortum barcoo]
RRGPAAAGMWMDTKTEVEEASRSRASLSRRALNALLLCTGDMEHLDEYMKDKLFVLQLAVWGLRGVTRVILANNPLSGALIMAALYWASPWQGLLGSLGVLASTLTAVIMGQDSDEVSGGLHGFNGMLVSLLMGVFSSAGDWYWWLLLPVCLGSASCVFLFSGLSSVLDHWDLPVTVFPFNIIIVLYLLCTGPGNLYFPHHPAEPPGALDPNFPELVAVEVIRGIPLGVGQIFACGDLGPSLLILGAVLLYSPLLAVHAVLGSAVGTLAGESPFVCARVGGVGELAEPTHRGARERDAGNEPTLVDGESSDQKLAGRKLQVRLGGDPGEQTEKTEQPGAGLSMAVRHYSLYSGLSGFNGALGCMAVGGLFFTFSWRTHLFAIASAFLSAYADIALSNLLGTVGLPACSWAATLTTTLMLLLTGSLAAYRIPTGQVKAPEHNLRSSQWEAGNTEERESTDV